MASVAPIPPFGPVLRQLRSARGLTIESAARRAKVSENYLGDIERGLRNPTMAVMARVLAGLRVSWTEFGQHLDAKGGSRR
jgi:transcriptional regulator with XRE-family HTH domain